MRTAWLEALIVAAAIALAFASSVTSPFLTYDDPLYVVSNPRIQADGLQALLHLWSPMDALDGRYIEYFPLRDTLYWILWHLSGAAVGAVSPVPFHIAGLVGHFCTSLLVGATARTLGVERKTAFAATLIFAVHPLHIESVVWVAALKDPLYLSFLLASFLFYARGSYASSNAALVASLLCKSMGFIAPLLFIAYEITRLERAPLRVVVNRLVLPSIISCAAVIFFLRVGRANAVVLGPWGGDWFTHYQIVAWIAARYIQQSLLPTDFRLFYCFAMSGSALTLRAVAGVVVVVAYGALTFSQRRRPLVALLLLWFPICLLPVMNIIPFQALMADRYTYASSVAICIGVATALARLRGRLGVVVTTVVIVTLTVVTAARASLWDDEAGLWRIVIEDAQCADQALPHVKLGDALARTEPREALEEYHRAMNMAAWNALLPRVQCETHAHAALLSLDIHDVPLAQKHLARALPLCPESPFVQNAAAEVASRTGDVDSEFASAERAAAVEGADVGLIWNRGVARLHAAHVDDAARDVVTAIEARSLVFCPLLAALDTDTSGKLADPGVRADALGRVHAAVGSRCRTP